MADKEEKRDSLLESLAAAKKEGAITIPHLSSQESHIHHLRKVNQAILRHLLSKGVVKGLIPQSEHLLRPLLQRTPLGHP